ncbi:MAG TPA: 2-phosphosulfolactate phosphatase [Bacillota bacterium]
MRIDVAFTVGTARSTQLRDQLVCVIDVLRASTSITAALAAGALAVWPAAEISEAKQLRDQLAAEGFGVVLAGERHAVPPPGFDLGNSPQDFRAAVVAGKHVVLTTTNGTRALVRAAAAGARRIYVAAFCNADAMVERLQADATDDDAGILLYAAGSEGRPSLEDTVCAGLLARELSLRVPAVKLSDAARIAMQAYVATAADWPQALLKGEHAQNLIAKGFAADVEWSLRISMATTVGLWQEGRITTARGL